MSFLNIAGCFGVFTVLVYAHGSPERETITTKSGDVRGLKLKAGDADVYAYLGIPYAVPPVGELRFKESTAVMPWKNIHNAVKLPPPCMQKLAPPIFEWHPIDSQNYNEDCLYLNIWAPANGRDTGKKAVMVWIHGGGFNTGSTNLNIYDGRYLAARGDVIVVSLNYRLGVFGFLYAGTEEAPGNVGMKDQVLAMRWVKDNIEAFRGDPSRITIFGESVGSISVSMHLVSPLTKGLFSRAIMESGTVYQPVIATGTSLAINMSSQISSNLGCLGENQTIMDSPSEVVSCLRNLPASDIAAAEKKLVGPMMTSFLPLRGGDYLPTHPMREFDAGNMHDVPVLIGETTDEGSFFLGYVDPSLLREDHPVINKEQGVRYIEAAYQQVSYPPTDVITGYYLNNVSDDRMITKRVYDSIGHWLLYCPGIFLSEAFSAKYPKVFHYILSHRREAAQFKEWMGVPHFEDVPFVFGTHLQLNNTYNPKDIEFSNNIIDTWTSFAKDGEPTFGLLGEKWPLYSKEKPVAVDLNPDNAKIVNPNIEECEFWRQYYG